MRNRWLGLGLMALLACGDGDTGSDSQASRHGGTESLCGRGTPVNTALGWEEQSALGVSAREAFAGLSGSCEAGLNWSAAGLSSVALAPMAGDTRITVAVELDQSSARLVERQPLSCGMKTLDVDAQVRFETEDGVFKDGGHVTLSYYSKSSSPMLSLLRKASELEGSLRASLTPKQSLSIQYRSSGADQACAGELQLTVSETQGNMGSASSSVIGRWSNSGCPLGEAAVALDGSSALGEAIKTEIAQRWSELALAGHWGEGSEATLLLSAQIASERACAQQVGVGMVTVPIRLNYATGDGRVASHAVDAHMNFFRANEALYQAQLVLSEAMTCARGATTFEDLDLPCSDYARVEAQILVNRYLDGRASDEMTLELYEYESADQTGSAGRVERLTSSLR